MKTFYLSIFLFFTTLSMAASAQTTTDQLVGNYINNNEWFKLRWTNKRRDDRRYYQPGRWQPGYGLLYTVSQGYFQHARYVFAPRQI